MPIYEYECEECSTKFEQRRSFGDGSEVHCPKCEGEAHRLFSPVPIIFNGSGFYATDSRRDGSESEESRGTSSSQEKADQ